MVKPYILFLIALVLSLNSPISAAENTTASTRLVYSVDVEIDRELLVTPGEGTYSIPQSVRLKVVDQQGNVSPLSPLMLDVYELYLSPDGTKIASRNLQDFSHNLIVLDGSGAQLVNYSFDPSSEGSALDWYLWGWRGNDALLLARFHDDRLTFSEFDLQEKQQRLQSVSFLNDFSVWPLSEIHEYFYNYGCICDVFQFSPSFRYVKTGYLPNQTPQEASGNPYPALFWDLETKAVSVFDHESPWYLMPHAAWTPSENMVVFEMWDDATQYNLYSFDFKTGLHLFNGLDCKADDCGAYDLTWDPNGQTLAFWQHPNAELITVDAATLQQKILFTPEHSYSAPVWSQDSSEIAIGEFDSKSHSSVGIRIIDAQSGETLHQYPVTDMDNFIGFLAS